MAYRRAEMNAVNGTDGEQSDLKIEFHYSFDNYFSGARRLLRIVPRLLQLRRLTDKALPLPEELITGLTMQENRSLPPPR